MEYILLNAYLGLIVFFVGTITLIVTLYKRKLITSIVHIVFIAVIQFFLSNLISLAVWRYWILDIDIMFLFVSIPALIAECITIPITLFILKRLSKTNKT